MSEQLTTNEALESELGIDPQRFNTVFSQVWGGDEDPEDRVHIDTEVESEIIDLIDEWAPEIHDAAGGPGEPDKGLFLIIEGAQATGKTTMTRFIRNQLDPSENPSREDIPMVIPVWDAIASNPTPYHYRDLLKNEGKRVFEDVEVPEIDEKINLLNGMNADLGEERISEIADEAESTPDQIEWILGQAGFGEGEYDPEEVVKQLANEGYLFVFVLDEMVSENDANKAKSVLKWFKDHLYPYVGLVLFTHPPATSAIKSEMQDQATRRNIDRTLEIAGDTYDIKKDIVINIRGKQHRIIDIEKLLRDYFTDVYIDDDHPEYGPLDEENLEWMKELLAAGGLIGNLINGVNSAIEKYAKDRANGNKEKEIGAYLFDECGRIMSHVQIEEKLEGNSDIEPDEERETVWRAKELITNSISVEDLDDKVQKELEDARVLIEDSETEELGLNPYLSNYAESDFSPGRDSGSETDEEDDQLATYRETVQSFSEDKADDRGTLRRNVDVGLATLLERINSEQVNISQSSALTLPGGKTPSSNFVEIEGSSTSGRAQKLEIKDGELTDYGYRFLLTTLFSDDSLNDPNIRDDIQEWFDEDNGILIVTNKEEEEISYPDWFNDPIDTQNWRGDNEYTWADLIQIIHVDRLRDLLGLFRHIQDNDFENDSEVLAEIRRLSDHSEYPELPEFEEIVTELYEDSSNAIQYIHENIYDKYEGPTIDEAIAFAAILDEIKERGFISEDVLDDLREEHGVEIESLKDKGALKEFDTEDGRTVIYLKEDFGSASKIGRVSGNRKLFPVGPNVFDHLEEFHEMESIFIKRDDDIIDEKLDDLDEKVDLIDFFLYDNDKLADIESKIENTEVSVFDDVLHEVEEAREVDEEDFNLVQEKFSSDQDLWSKIQDLDVDDDISPIHRELFYAKLPKQPPTGAAEYIDDDRNYPLLIYQQYDHIQDILSELDDVDEEVSKGFEDQSGELNELRKELEEFTGIDSEEEDEEEVELNDSKSEELADLSKEDLKDFDFESLISDIAENQNKRNNVTSATGLLTRVDGAREDFVDDTDKESLQDIEHDTAEEYVDTGKQIIESLLDDEVLFDDESDKPEATLQDFRKFCNQLKQLLQDSAQLEVLKEKAVEERKKVESIPGDDIEAKINHLEQKEEDLEDAQRYLKLKEKHCDVCKSEWEDLSQDRKDEIEDELDRIKEEYSDIDFSLDSIEEGEEKVEEKKDEAEEVKKQLKSIQKKKSEIDLSEYTSELEDLSEKYAD